MIWPTARQPEGGDGGFAEANPGADLSGPAYEAFAPGTYVVYAVDDASGCLDSATVTVGADYVAPTVAVDFVGDARLLNCAYDAVPLRAVTPHGPDSAQAFFAAEGLPDELTVTEAGEYWAYVVAAVDIEACVDSFRVSVTEDYTVPTAAIDAPLGATLTCDLPNVPLLAVTDPRPDAVLLTWLSPGGDEPVYDATEIEAGVAGTYTLHVEHAVSACATEVTQVITGEFTPPAVSVETPDGTTLTCATPQVRLSAKLPADADELTLTWSAADDEVVIADPTAAEIVVEAPGTYFLDVVSEATGCRYDTAIVIDARDAAPTAAIAAGPRVLTCATPAVTLDGTPSSAAYGGVLAYAWTLDGDPDGALLSEAARLTAEMPGTYRLTVAEPETGCTHVTTAVVTAAPGTVAAALASDFPALTCDVAAVTLDASGSAGEGLRYAWSHDPELAGATAVVTAAGTYTVTVTDATGCADAATVTVGEDYAAPAVDVDAPAGLTLTCRAPALDLVAVSSPGPDTVAYYWTSDNAEAAFEDPTAAAQEALLPGRYVLEATHLWTGCTSATAVDVTEDLAAPLVTIDAPQGTELSCATPALTLGADVEARDGGAELAWLRDGALAGAGLTLDVSAPGRYTLVAEDVASGCVDSAHVDVTAAPGTAAAALAADAPALTCAVSAVTLDASASQGQGLSFAWTRDGAAAPALTGAVVTVTAPGTYAVIVEDDAGCTSSAAVVVGEDYAAPAVTIDAPEGTALTCATPAVTLAAASSPGPDTVAYSWTSADPEVAAAIVEPDAATIEASVPGVYVLEVTHLGTGCTTVAEATVTEDYTAPEVRVDTGATAALSCRTDAVTLAAVLGDGDLDAALTWSAEDPEAAAAIEDPHAPTIDVYLPGAYALTVEHASTGCSSIVDVVVREDYAAPTVAIDAAEGTVLSPTRPTLPLAADVEARATGALLTWLRDGTLVGDGAALTVDAPGRYTLVAEDAVSGCVDSAAVTVTREGTGGGEVVAVLVASAPALTCAAPNVTLDASASTGEGLTFAWPHDPGLTGSTAVVAEAGTYAVIIADAAGAVDTASVDVGDDRAAPAVAIDAPEGTTLSCARPSLRLVAYVDPDAGADADGLAFAWTLGGALVGEDPTLDVTAAGAYVLAVTDVANGCRAVDSVQVTAADARPSARIDAPEGTVLTCAAPALPLRAGGYDADAGYDLTWTLDGAAVGEEPELLAVAAGTYVLTVTDAASGCSAADTLAVASETDLPAIGIDAPAGTALTCAMAALPLTVTGLPDTNPDDPDAPGDYAPTWTLDGEPFGEGGTVTATAPGVYVATLTEGDCTTSASVTVTGDSDGTSVRIVTADSVLTCATEAVTLTAQTAGDAPAYAWSTGETTASIDVTVAGVYVVTVGDVDGGCFGRDSIVIAADTAAPVALIRAETTVLTCATTELALVATDGTQSPPVTYAWSTGATTARITVTAPEKYAVTITDAANGCSAAAEVTVTQDTTAPRAVLAAPADTVLGCGREVVLDASGSDGASGLSFAWSDGVVGATRVAASAGTYVVAVTDTVNGCVSEAAATVTDRPTAALAGELEALFLVGAEVCAGQELHVLDYSLVDGADVLGALEGAAFAWDFGDGATGDERDPVHRFRESGTYTVRLSVTPGEGCPPAVVEKDVSARNCLLIRGEDGVAAAVTPNYGAGPFTFEAELPFPEDVRLVVTDPHGQVIEARAFAEARALREEVAFPGPGVYLVSLQYAGGVETRRVIVSE